MTLARFTAAVFFGAICGFVACGGSPAAPPRNPPAATSPHATAETGSAATPQTKPADGESMSDQVGAQVPPGVDPAKLHGTIVNAGTSNKETFPSGLVIDAQLVGGPAPGPELPKGTRVLHVGDSFAGALGIELNKVLNAAGLESRLEFEKSTYIPTWAHGPKLARLMASFKPDLVLISLGANELENPEAQKRASLIQKLVKSLGATPCVWVAPVLWAGAKSALLDVIRANVGGCVYLDSNELVKKMPRAGDKIHPSMAARPDWAVATARWLAYHRKPTESKRWNIVSAP
jgi:hypothetical protein